VSIDGVDSAPLPHRTFICSPSTAVYVLRLIDQINAATLDKMAARPTMPAGSNTIMNDSPLAINIRFLFRCRTAENVGSKVHAIAPAKLLRNEHLLIGCRSRDEVDVIGPKRRGPVSRRAGSAALFAPPRCSHAC
jgi:hypothetical protein